MTVLILISAALNLVLGFRALIEPRTRKATADELSIMRAMLR